MPIAESGHADRRRVGRLRRHRATGGNALYYLHSDHLSSTSLTTDSSGGEVARQNYYPYGAIRSGGSMPTDIGFTGQRAENSSLGSLMFYNARFYSPAVGRFLSADTIVPEPGNSQAFNRYSYVNNNPLKDIDPSGHRTCSAQQAATGDETCSQNYPNEGDDSTGFGLPDIPQEYLDLPAFVNGRDQAARAGYEIYWSNPALFSHNATIYYLANDYYQYCECGLGPAKPVLLPEGLDPAAHAMYLEAIMLNGFAMASASGMPMNGLQLRSQIAARGTTSNRIGRWGEAQVADQLSGVADVRPFRVPSGQRIYDGRFIGTEMFIEIKTSSKGVVSLNRLIRTQIAFDTNMSPKPIWIFVNARPSSGLQGLLQQAGIPWHELHVP